MKRLILLLISLVLSFQIHAQKIIMNRVKRFDGTWKPLFLGQRNGDSYFLVSNNLVRYSSDYKKIKRILLDESCGWVTKAFMSSDEIVLICREDIALFQMWVKTLIVVKTFDFDGKLRKKTILLEEKENRLGTFATNPFKDYTGGPEAHGRIELTVSDNYQYLGLHYVSLVTSLNRKDKFLIFNTRDFRQLTNVDLPLKDNLQCFVLNNGGFLTLQGDDIDMEDCVTITDPLTLAQYNADGVLQKKLVLPLKPGLNEFRNGLFYKLDEEKSAFYVAVNFAAYTPKRCNNNQNWHGVSSVQLEKINLDSLKPVLSRAIQIDSAMVKKVGILVLLKAKRELLGFKVLDIKEKSEDVFVFGEIRNGGYVSDAPGSVHYAHQIIFKESPTHASVQKVNKTKFQPLFPSYSVIFNKSDVYLVYSELKIWRTKFTVVKLDENLEELNRSSLLSRRLFYRIFLNPTEYYKVSATEYLFFGNYEYSVGSAIVDVE